MADVRQISESALHEMNDEKLRELAATVLEFQAQDAKEWQLLYYIPAHDKARQAHLSTAKTIACFGGNRSSKTDSMFAEMCSLATGVFPQDPEIREAYRKKFRGPVNMRIVIQSMKSHLHPVILPKFRWYTWNGIKPAGGVRGHWGWIPKACLLEGDWDKSWSEKLTTLTVRCLDPDDYSRELGKSIIQFMSLDMDLEAFASGTFDEVMHDEPPHEDIWRENKMRVMDNDGRMRVAMTWPDDPAITVDWLHDQVYEPSLPGPYKDPNIDSFVFDTRQNVHLDQTVVARELASMDEQTRQVRIEGGHLRFSNLVHPLFTNRPTWWCFGCGKTTVPTEGEKCSECGGSAIAEFCHVGRHEIADFWPCVFLLDPHPRKPHMFAWVAVDPNDDYWMVHEGQVDGDPVEVREYVDAVEEEFGLHTAWRLMDPNMGATVSSPQRDRTWQDEFSIAGLHCDLADDSAGGRQKLNHYLKPDEGTFRPRFHIHERCGMAVHQFLRFRWDDFKRVTDRGQKQAPKDKDDDYPALGRYLLNAEPTFQFLRGGAPILQRPGTRRGAY